MNNILEFLEATAARRDKLNALGLTALHFVSGNGTDLRIGLAEGALFEGAASTTPAGQKFIGGWTGSSMAPSPMSSTGT